MAQTDFQTALIVGVGSGLCASLARTFAKAGMKVALAARTVDDLAALAKETGGKAFACDATKRAEVAKLFADVEAALGAPDVVVYNASYRTRGPFVELDPAEVEKSIAVSAFGGFLVAQEAVKRMLPRGHGAILFTGASASVKGYAQSAPFAMGKFALRGLAQSMARELSPQGIHVAHVVIDGGIRSARRPDAAGPARQHARSRRHRADLSPPAAAARAAPGPGRSSCGPGSRSFESGASERPIIAPCREFSQSPLSSPLRSSVPRVRMRRRTAGARRGRSSMRRLQRRSTNATALWPSPAPSMAGPTGWRSPNAAASTSSSTCSTPMPRCTPAWSIPIRTPMPSSQRSSKRRSASRPRISMPRSASWRPTAGSNATMRSSPMTDSRARLATGSRRSMRRSPRQSRAPRFIRPAKHAYPKACSETLAPMS